MFPARGSIDNHCRLVLHALGETCSRSAAAQALHAAGFSLVAAQSNADVRELMRSRTPDALVLDSALPGDGLELCRALRRTAEGKELPIFMVVGDSSRQSIEEAFAAGATDVVSPPVSWFLQAQRLQRVLGTAALLRRLREDRYSLEEARRKALDASDAMLRLKHYDDLTGLPNRTLMMDFLSLALARAERNGAKVGVLLLDIDGFKEINESLGRQRGDELLREVGKRLRRCLRSTDYVARDTLGSENTAVARLSGDEFVILMHEVESRDAVEIVADRLLAAVSEPFAVDRSQIYLSSCVGVAIAPQDGDSEDTLVQRAETAMYHAKRKGPRNRLFFERSMKSAAVHKLEIKLGLRRALEEEEFLLQYQPLLDPEGHITALEALIRWQHPERGLVMPLEFIPIAEDTGLMVPIGDWVVNEVCRQLDTWGVGGGRVVPVSLNIALSQLEQPDFVGKVESILARHQTDPALIQFELSERGVLRNDPQMLGQLEALRATGIRLAIDDFGTGQTSLAYLRRFPLDVVKIDRSFVVGLTRDDDADAITSAILAMAQQLKLKAVAEGVETPEQSDFLRLSGCDELQGFLFFRPLPAREVAPLLQKQGALAHTA